MALLVHQQAPMTEAAKYREKYRQLKRHTKEMIFLNAAYCDEVVRIEEKVVRVKEERRYLLRRLLQYQPADAAFSAEIERPYSSSSSFTSTSANAVVTSSNPNARTPLHNNSSELLSSATAALNTILTRPPSQSIAQLLGEVDKRRKKTDYKRRPATDSVTKGKENMNTLSGGKKSRPRHVKRRVTTTPIELPIVLGSLTIYCLGEVVPLPGYYTSENIYPVGFCSTRSYTSINDLSTTCVYSCKIVDSGSAAMFVITPEGTSDVSYVGDSPSECVQQLLNDINTSRGSFVTVSSDSESGAEFFGLSHPVVLKLIRSHPGTRKCINYQSTSCTDADIGIEKNVNLLNTSSVITTLSSQQH